MFLCSLLVPFQADINSQNLARLNRYCHRVCPLAATPVSAADGVGVGVGGVGVVVGGGVGGGDSVGGVGGVGGGGGWSGVGGGGGVGGGMGVGQPIAGMPPPQHKPAVVPSGGSGGVEDLLGLGDVDIISDEDGGGAAGGGGRVEEGPWSGRGGMAELPTSALLERVRANTLLGNRT